VRLEGGALEPPEYDMAAVVVADLPAPDGGEFGVDPERIRNYESVDPIDAAHPQTILAYDMNGKPLTVPHGAPLRLRLERQLGYKMTKYIMRRASPIWMAAAAAIGKIAVMSVRGDLRCLL
jgi:molybdopterin-dependent oxidoreductase-like protein protein